jgi:hypothetical protein
MQKESKQKHFAVLRNIQLFYRATTFCATCDEDRYEFSSPYFYAIDITLPLQTFHIRGFASMAVGTSI